MFHFSFKKFSSRSFDWVLMGAVLLLVSIGFEAIYSVDLSRGADLFLVKKQFVALLIGLVAIIITSQASHNTFRSLAKPLYAGTMILLVMVLILGTNIRGTKGWFVLPGFSVQPVELMKLGLIALLAYIVSNFGRRFEQPLFFFGTGVVTAIPILLTLLQPDLGSAALLGAVWFALVCLVGVRKRYIFLLLGSLLVLSIIAWNFVFKPYQKDRILDFIYPEKNALTSGYNLTQSIIAVGSGNFFGKGLGFGSQSQLRFLPEAQTDFIFSVIAEELGFVGVCVLLFLYAIIIWRLTLIAKNANDDFIVASVMGIATLFLSQIVVNLGAEVGLLPITGVTLPLVSYGGSSLIVNLLMIGIVQGMIVKRY